MDYFSKTQRESKKLENLGSNSWARSNNEVCGQKTTVGASQSQSAKYQGQGEKGLGAANSRLKLGLPSEKPNVNIKCQMHVEWATPLEFMPPSSSCGVFFNTFS